MGTYATTTFLLPSATTDSSHAILDLTDSDLNTATIVSLIDRRERMVESYLGKRYAMPMTQSALVTKIVEDFVTYDAYNLLLNRDSGLVDQPAIQSNYDFSLGMLSDLQKGFATLIDNNGNIVSERNIANKIYSDVKDFVPTFDVGDPLKWTVSSDRQDSLDDDRDND